MGMMDDMKGKMNMDSMKDRYEELKSKADSGNISDSEREELASLRERLE